MTALLTPPKSRIWTPEPRRVVHPWTSREVCEICNRRKVKCCCDDDGGVSDSTGVGTSSDEEYSFSVVIGDTDCHNFCGPYPLRFRLNGDFINLPSMVCTNCPQYDGLILNFSGFFAACDWSGSDSSDCTLNARLTITSGSPFNYAVVCSRVGGSLTFVNNSVPSCRSAATLAFSSASGSNWGCNISPSTNVTVTPV
jgi:hypothetical protein